LRGARLAKTKRRGPQKGVVMFALARAHVRRHGIASKWGDGSKRRGFSEK
jgi:hypothetical protein